MEQLDPVRARTPADRAFARPVRMLITSVAASAGLEFDRVGDVALATNEAFGQLIALPGVESVLCEAAPAPGSLDVTLSAVPSPGDAPAGPWPDTLARRVLEGVTEHVEHAASRAVVRFRVGGR